MTTKNMTNTYNKQCDEAKKYHDKYDSLQFIKKKINEITGIFKKLTASLSIKTTKSLTDPEEIKG